VNDQDILNCATQAAEWLLDRRERLEKHEVELLAMLWLSVSEIETIIDSFDTLEAAHGLTLNERVLRDDLLDWIGGSGVRQARDARPAVRPPADADALLSPEPVARRCGLSRRAVYRAIERGELRASRLCSRIRIRARTCRHGSRRTRSSPLPTERGPRGHRRSDPRTSSEGCPQCGYCLTTVQRGFQLGLFQQVTAPLEGLRTGHLNCEVRTPLSFEPARVRRRGRR
jgi:excisionase family DNA binding protein